MSSDSPAGEVTPPAAAIVTIGDELLVGDRIDSNSAWLARHLTELGFQVSWMASAGDRIGDIGDALAVAAARADVVLVTGGLGPTPDDRTREGVAARWGLELREDPSVLETLIRRYEGRGEPGVPPAVRRLAQVPGPAEVLTNDLGTAPGLHLRLPGEGRSKPLELILLPGMPGEMRGLVLGSAGAILRERWGVRLHPPATCIIRTAGIGESALSQKIERVQGRATGVEIAFRPSARGVELRLSARGPDAEGRLRSVEAALAPELEPYRYEHPSGELAGAVGQLLLERGLRVAAAESCTGGLLLGRLTDIPGSSAWVVGGVVAYADRVKEERLDVSPTLLAEEGAVSEGVARAMAQGVARILNVDVGVGLTGIAGPGGAVPGKPVGTVCFGISVDDEVEAESRVFPGDREEVRERAIHHAMHLLLRRLTRPPVPPKPRANKGPPAG